jgi:hypothetical protein
VQALEMVLEPLIEEGIQVTPIAVAHDEECVAQATTYVVPVLQDESGEQWLDVSDSECPKLVEEIGTNLNTIEEERVQKLESIEEKQETETTNTTESTSDLPTQVSITYTEATDTEPSEPKNDDGEKENSPEPGVVEVRKRHSNTGDSSSDRNSANGNGEDEKRRIDKSRRRKGIYIQWSTIDRNHEAESDTNENLTPDETNQLWQSDQLMRISKESSIDAEADGDNENRNVIIEPFTPDSERGKPDWVNNNNNNNGKKGLMYQSSDEREENNSTSTASSMMRPFRNLFFRSDSVSDNESDRGSSRDRTSASPAPGECVDSKRYLKRPLRGPYGQMLEAEMKKPSKINYNELLDELNRHDR